MERFDRDKLEFLLKELNIPAATCELINYALVDPLRRVECTQYSSPSRIPCPKMLLVMQSESSGVERKAIFDYIFRDDVVGYLDQAIALDLIYNSKSGKKVRHPHVVDFLVFEKHNILLEEWKPESAKILLPEKQPGRYILEDGLLRSPPAEQAAQKLGLNYRIRTDNELSEIEYRNRDFLRSYLYPNAKIEKRALSVIKRFFEMESYTTISNLQASLPDISLDDIYFFIANGHITADLKSLFIGEKNRFVLFRDEISQRAFNDALTSIPVENRAKKWSKNLFSPGERVVFSGKEHTILVSGINELWLQTEQGESFSLSHLVAERAFKSQQLQVIAVGPEEDPLVLNSPLKHATPEMISHALKIKDLLRKWQRNEARPAGDYSDRTYREYQKKEREAIAAGQDPLLAFLPAWSKRGNTKSRLCEAVEKIIETVFESQYENLIGRNIGSVYGTLRDALKNAGYSQISRVTFSRRVKKYRSDRTVCQREGRKAAYQKAKFIWNLELRTPPHGDYAMHIVHIDHTELEIELIESKSGRNLGRPWLTLIICAYTRRVLGFFLSFNRPRYISCMAAIFDMVRRFSRVPDVIVYDGGAEFGATDFEKLLAFLEIEGKARPKSAARAGSVLERFFGSTQTVFIHNLIGNTKMRRKVRLLTPENNPSKLAVFNMADLYDGIDEFFFGLYEKKAHCSLRVSPREAFEDSLIKNGRRLHRLRNVEDLIPVAFPTVRGQTRSLDPQRGVMVNYEWHRNPRLEVIVDERVDVLVKPHLMRKEIVYVLYKGEWYPCYSGSFSENNNLTDYEHQAAFEELIADESNMREINDDFHMDVAVHTDKMNDERMQLTVPAPNNDLDSQDNCDDRSVNDPSSLPNPNADPKCHDGNASKIEALVEKLKQTGTPRKTFDL